jgi:FkbM family methyltransferase
MESVLLNRVVKLVRILSTGRYAWALAFHGAAATVEHASILAPLACRTVVDVGANRGQFALVAQRCFPQARIISFEPLSATFSRLQRVMGKDPLFAAHQVALGDVSGETTMHVAGRDYSSSLLPITDLQGRLFPGTSEKSTRMVRVGRLGEFVDADQIVPPALLKLDVQGYELLVLKGCVGILDRFLHVYVECSFVELCEGQALAGEVVAWMRDRGFSLRGVFNTVVHGEAGAIQADFLFKNSKKIA